MIALIPFFLLAEKSTRRRDEAFTQRKHMLRPQNNF